MGVSVLTLGIFTSLLAITDRNSSILPSLFITVVGVIILIFYGINRIPAYTERKEVAEQARIKEQEKYQAKYNERLKFWVERGCSQEEAKLFIAREEERERESKELRTRKIMSEMGSGGSKCPSCGKLSYRAIDSGKAFSKGKAVAGFLIAGVAGGVIGGVNGRKTRIYRCNECGYQKTE